MGEACLEGDPVGGATLEDDLEVGDSGWTVLESEQKDDQTSLGASNVSWTALEVRVIGWIASLGAAGRLDVRKGCRSGQAAGRASSSSSVEQEAGS